jgi:hypothetical protein
MAKTQITTKTVEERDAADDDEIDPLELTPLFDRGKDRKSKTITKISIRRTDPDEGHLGYMAPDASEGDIKQKYGGGEFTLQAKNDSGQIVHTLTNFKIAGDPIFQSEIAEARWLRLNRVTARSNGEGGSVKEILASIEERESKRREEERERRAQERQEALDREERNRREQREHEEKLAKDTADREERRRKDDTEREERRRAEAREDEERRTRLHREDLDRADAASKAQLAQTQQFFQQLQALNKRDDAAAAGTDPIKILTTGMDLALKMREGAGGGEPTDALTALLSRLPETLAEVRTTAKEAYHEVAAKGQKKAAALTAKEAPAKGDTVTISGPTATRLKQMIEVLQRAGKDPEKAIDDLSRHVIRMATQPAAPVAPAARPPAPARAAPRRAGEAPKRAAARRPARKK